MSFKIPCGGFKLDEKSFSLDENGVLSVSGGGGGGSVPKPLTFDYMPEGYPTKSVQTTTLMEEQEVAFVLEDAAQYTAYLNGGVEIVEGQTYTVNWDGAEYECVCVTFFSLPAIGNLSITSSSAYDTGEPFIYVYDSTHARGAFSTLDTSASHTISVKQIEEIVTPMAEEFLPSEVDELIMNSSTTGSTKKFKITVDDSGIISATEVT